MNWFAVAVIVLQFGAAVWFFVHGSGWHGGLWALYAAANVVLLRVAYMGAVK